MTEHSKYPLSAAAEQALSDLGYALDELGCTPRRVQYIPVVGSAGRTGIACMAASVLQAAGFRVGLFCPDMVAVNGVCADAHDWANLDAVIDRCFDPADRGEATRLACAVTLFEEKGCDYALLELTQPALAQGLSRLAACVVGAVDEPAAQRVAELASAFRGEVPVITLPGQAKAAVQELVVAAGTVGCALTVPDEKDFTPVKHRRLHPVMDYGGYRVPLTGVGHHVAQNAAAVIELALALWRSGAEIEDEAILDGLSAARCGGPVVIGLQPPVLADCCHTPVQAAALTRALKEECLETVSVLAVLPRADAPEAFFAALESGRVTADVTEKEQMAGMADCPIDKVYLADCGLPGLHPAEVLNEAARYHFETVLCGTVQQALAAALSDGSDAVVLCGPSAFVAAARQLLTFDEEPGEEPD